MKPAKFAVHLLCMFHYFIFYLCFILLCNYAQHAGHNICVCTLVNYMQIYLTVYNLVHNELTMHINGMGCFLTFGGILYKSLCP